MIQLIFIRHGATAGNLEKRYIGSTDEPLCDVGVAQVEALRKHNFQADFLYVSPMRRTLQTAELLFPEMFHTIVENFGRQILVCLRVRQLKNCPTALNTRRGWTQCVLLPFHKERA